MLIAHLPAGYIAARGARTFGSGKALFWGILAGSLLPDLDILWFYFVDQGTVNHRFYLTHRPIVWAAVLLAGVVLRRGWIAGLGLGALLHMVLDSLAAPVGWLWPFSDRTVMLVTVPATHPNWVISFVTHWTFSVEIAIVLVAGFLFLTRRRA